MNRPTATQLRAKRAALLAFAAPTLFTFAGVVLYMLHDPVSDTWLWVACWAIALAVLLPSDSGAPASVTSRLVPVPLRVAHGVSALALVRVFLALHITNHLMFPAGAGTYDAVMKVFRRVYGTDILQPVLVALFLFQICTSRSASSNIECYGRPCCRSSTVNNTVAILRCLRSASRAEGFVAGTYA